MRSRPPSSRIFFVAVLVAIVVVYLVGRTWMRSPTGAQAKEAGLVPSAAPSGPK